MRHKKFEVIGGAMRNHNIVIIISVVFMIIGAIALIKMPRNEFPQFTIRQGRYCWGLSGRNLAGS